MRNVNVYNHICVDLFICLFLFSINMISFQDLLGIIGLFLTILSYLIPLPDLYRMYKYKGDAVSKFPYLIFICQIISCQFWVLYGFEIDLLPLKVSESIGLIINLLFIIVYAMCLYIKPYKKKVLVTWIVIVYMIFLFICLDNKTIQIIYGPLGNTFSIITTLSTVQHIKEVLVYKDSSYIAINIVSVYLIDSIDWFLYSILLSDFNLFLSNLIGICVCGFQVYFYFKYRKTVA